LTPGFVGRFRQVISKREIGLMQALAGREMLAHGYQLEPIQLSFIDRLVVNWPINRARAAAWRTLGAIRHRVPSQLRRKRASKTAISRHDSRITGTETT
jgi:hypothetical protein